MTTPTTSPAVLLSHPAGNQNVRNALRSFVEHGMLAEFWTTVTWDTESAWNRLLPDGVQAQLARRSFPEAPTSKVRTLPWMEIVRLGARSTPLEPLLCSGERMFSTFGVYRHFSRRVARRLTESGRDVPAAIYTYELAANVAFREAKRRGITRIYEKDSSYWEWARTLYREEVDLNPEFASSLTSLTETDRFRKWEYEELQLADHIIVPSDHVRRTLAGVVPEEKIRVVTFGAPEVRPRTQFNLDPKAPLKVLFVGNLGQHKGISYLLEAMEMLGDQAELTLIGCRRGPNVKIDEACRRWRWLGTMPHPRVLDRMQEADVFVFPSLAEGCALVVLEALACGLPVIVTPNTGTTEIIQDGREGYVVPIRRAEVIASRLETLHRDRDLLAEMSRQAQVTAAENSWEGYRAHLASVVRSVVWR